MSCKFNCGYSHCINWHIACPWWWGRVNCEYYPCTHQLCCHWSILYFTYTHIFPIGIKTDTVYNMTENLSLNNITGHSKPHVFRLKKDPTTKTTKLWWKKWSTDKVCKSFDAQDAWVSSWQYFRGFCRKSLPADSLHSNGYELCPSSRRHLSVFIRSRFHTIFALFGKETFSILVQSHLQVHRWCIVHKQPIIRKLSGSDVSCWTWDQGHHREHHFCFLPRFTSVDWEGLSTSHFHLQQARWFQFPHHKLSVPE